MFSQFTGLTSEGRLYLKELVPFFLVLLLVVYWELVLKHQDQFIHHGTCVKETP